LVLHEAKQRVPLVRADCDEIPAHACIVITWQANGSSGRAFVISHAWIAETRARQAAPLHPQPAPLVF
jgi:hypothetical protein